MLLANRKNRVFIMVGILLIGLMFSTLACAEELKEFEYSSELFIDKRVSYLLSDEEQRIYSVIGFILEAAKNNEYFLNRFKDFDFMSTKVYLASVPSSSYFINMFLYSTDDTWAFIGSTHDGRVSASKLTTLKPELADVMMSSLKSSGSIGDYYSVSYFDAMLKLSTILE